MRRTRTTTLAVLLALPACGGFAAGVPLQAVPPGTKWILHVDAAGLTSSAVWRLLLRQPGPDGVSLEARLRALEAAAGFGLGDLGSVTVCGAAGRPPVAILRGRRDAAGLMAQAGARPGCRRQRRGALEMLSLPLPVAAGGDGRARIHFCSPGPAAVIASLSPEEAEAAAAACAGPGIDLVIRRRFGGLARQAGSGLVTLLSVEGQLPTGGAGGAWLSCPCEALALTLRQVPGEEELAATLDMATAGEEAAADLLQAASGLRAVLGLRAVGDAAFAVPARSFRAEARGRNVRAVFRLDAEALRLLTPAAWRHAAGTAAR